MTPIDDERFLFYLRHQQRIDEWSDLREPAWAAMHDFLCSLKNEVAALATEFDEQTFEKMDEGYSHPKLFLHSSEWLREPEPYPRVAIGVEWDATEPLGFTVRGQCPYVGVYVN
jgi:hypothetical protein